LSRSTTTPSTRRDCDEIRIPGIKGISPEESLSVVRCADAPGEDPKKVLARHLKSWKPPAHRYTTGVLAKYIKLVQPGATGTVTGIVPSPSGRGSGVALMPS